ncbi:hypothetical protein HQQ80_17360 [Microbacteriaceae bacterium VKM Ac-2855]|nr:hypothetical protein [Microbacteriaceae bacterium VKM Ac-2855]
MEQLTVALLAARHVADLTARMHIDALWHAKQDPDEARWMLQRLAAEKRAARLALVATHDASWWDAATVDDIAAVYQGARIWSRDDADLALLEQRLVATLRCRYRISIEHSNRTSAA